MESKIKEHFTIIVFIFVILSISLTLTKSCDNSPNKPITKNELEQVNIMYQQKIDSIETLNNGLNDDIKIIDVEIEKIEKSNIRKDSIINKWTDYQLDSFWVEFFSKKY